MKFTIDSIKSKEVDVNICRGLFWKCYISTYISNCNIEKKTSLRLLKKKSCPGCEKCSWIFEFLNEEKECGSLELGCLEDKKIYTIEFHSFQGPEDLYPDIYDWHFVEE